MSWARYPTRRNYKERCRLQDVILAYKAEIDAFSDTVYAIDDETVFETERDKLDAMYNRLNEIRRYQFSLEYPCTKNQWFTNVIAGYKDGFHRISAKQFNCFAKYTEYNREADDKHLYGRVGNRLVCLSNISAMDKYTYMTIETLNPA